MNVKEIDYINKPFKKFIETLQFSEAEWEVDTPDGWVDINASGKTIEYEVYKLSLEGNIELKCADNHIVIAKEFTCDPEEMYVQDLTQDHYVLTNGGYIPVVSVVNLGYSENMYDLEINSESKLYYTNDIVSHNSIWLANMCANSVKLGYHSAYISLEMRDRKVVKRLGANLLGITMGEYQKIAYDGDLIKKKLASISHATMKMPGKLFVKEYPTSTASILDVERYLLRMEESQGFRFKTVFIDYINIMRNWRNANSENTYMKIKQLAEDMRAMAMRNDWAVITATQVNRDGFDATDIKMTNVSESAALIHTIDAMFGIIQDPVMHANCEYILKLLANRDDGHKNTKRKFNINYDLMRITEDPHSEMWNDE